MLGVMMIKAILILLGWLVSVVAVYDYAFSTENIPKFRKIGDNEDKVQKRMREFFYNGFTLFTVIAVLAFIYI